MIPQPEGQEADASRHAHAAPKISEAIVELENALAELRREIGFRKRDPVIGKESNDAQRELKACRIEDCDVLLQQMREDVEFMLKLYTKEFEAMMKQDEIE